ncbi:flagellar basal-body rod protein FlgF [Sphingomonas morindae]|uniref:Flagellar basal-body rod protein FlgF n=1 Tax=Sphingomonas morindae TaxID=1541170 RepID=A0ABY4XA10_9SPHN|nr:flagellar basal-body rod protein FlgF [Sphingomonas morindae]USI73739.1 flagellar basal-body rod protein FlgF [Sphingomonas morindae]
MDRLIYTSLSAMRALMDRQTVTAGNLANANTTGFRGDMADTQAIYLDATKGVTTARAQTGQNVQRADYKQGAVVETGRDLDVALEGDAMLSVQGADGQEAYTRRGDLKVADTGLLTTGDGLPVLGDGGPITLPPADKVTIDKTGAVWVVPTGGDPAQPQQVDQLKLVSPAGSAITKQSDGLFHVAAGGTLPGDPTARLTSGALEGSNVDVTRTLTDMIEASRSYETQVKLLSGAKEMDSSTAELMNLPS